MRYSKSPEINRIVRKLVQKGGSITEAGSMGGSHLRMGCAL